MAPTTTKTTSARDNKWTLKTPPPTPKPRSAEAAITPSDVTKLIASCNGVLNELDARYQPRLVSQFARCEAVSQKGELDKLAAEYNTYLKLQTESHKVGKVMARAVQGDVRIAKYYASQLKNRPGVATRRSSQAAVNIDGYFEELDKVLKRANDVFAQGAIYTGSRELWTKEELKKGSLSC